MAKVKTVPYGEAREDVAQKKQQDVSQGRLSRLTSRLGF